MKDVIVFPPEWYPQSGIQICWPHSDTDWRSILDEVTRCYVSFSREILKQGKLLVICHDLNEVDQHFTSEEKRNLILVKIESNDTWARDHGAISVFHDGNPVILDFGFNGWGLKFPANKDNLITSKLYEQNIYNTNVLKKNCLDFILEGGSIESDGKGTILTTSKCLLAPNRNQPLEKENIEEYLKNVLGAKRILWLNHGYLAGDDTDSHIDTLVRFCNENTIAYVKCDDINDEHYPDLKMMEYELKSFTNHKGQPYNLVDLPMADAMYGDGGRLPATYANFLILNKSVLVPEYGSSKDEIAKMKLEIAFPDREIVGVDCRPLIKQFGSLHCVTMQFPEGFL